MFAPWKKSYGKPGQCIRKHKHYFANRVTSSQSYGFSSSHVPMWELDHKDGWVLKHWCFWTVVLENSSPISPSWTARSNHSILNIHWKDWCWSWSSNALANLMQRADSLGKTLILGKTEGRRRRGRQRTRWLDGITDSMDMSLSKLREWRWTGKPGTLQSMGLQTVGQNSMTK